MDNCEHPSSRRGQLQRQRQPVEPAADLADVGRVHGREAETGPTGQRALDEQEHGFTRGDSRQVRALGRRGERGHRPGVLAVQPEHLAARHEHLQARASPKQVCAEAGARLDQVLAVVQHQQQPLRTEAARQRLGEWLGRALDHAERRCHSGRDERGIGDCAKLDQPRPVGEAVCPPSRGFERQSRLARPGRTGQGHQSQGVVEQRRELFQFPLSADEAAERRRQGRRGLYLPRVRQGWSRVGDDRSGGGPKDSALRGGERQRLSQQDEGIQARQARSVPLQVANGARREAGPLGQGLLR